MDLPSVHTHLICPNHVSIDQSVNFIDWVMPSDKKKIKKWNKRTEFFKLCEYSFATPISCRFLFIFLSAFSMLKKFKQKIFLSSLWRRFSMVNAVKRICLFYKYIFPPSFPSEHDKNKWINIKCSAIKLLLSLK